MAALLPAGVRAAVVTPHPAVPKVVEPHVLAPPPAATQPPATTPGTPSASAAEEGIEPFLVPECSIETPCTPEQRELKEIREAQKARDEEERFGPFAGHQVELEWLRALEEAGYRLGVMGRQFASQLICPLYDQAIEVVSDARVLLNGLGIPEGEILAGAETAIGTAAGERSCFSTREP